MKIETKLSLISMVIAIICCLIKLAFDIKAYHFMTEVVAQETGDIQPSIIASQVIEFFIMLLFSLVLCIIGLIKKNRYRKRALALNIFTIIYVFIPLGVLLAIL